MNARVRFGSLRFLACAVPAILANLPQFAFARPGDPDPSFGTGGSSRVSVRRLDNAETILRQSDGRIILAGHVAESGPYQFALLRFTPDGALDPAFGTGGIVTADFGGRMSILDDAALQADGRIVAVGRVEATAGSAVSDTGLMRFLPNGSLDPAFGTGGKLTTPLGTGDEWMERVTVLADGKILVAGASHDGTQWDFALARFLPDGSFDPGFGSGGKVIPFESDRQWLYDLAVHSDGRITVAGTSGYSHSQAIIRYLENGALDTTFGTNGKIISDTPGYPRRMKLLPDGRILFAGSALRPSNGNQSMLLMRYTPNGVLDLRLDIPAGLHSLLSGVESLPDGRLLAFGSVWDGNLNYLALLRMDANGALDSRFGPDGLVINAVVPWTVPPVILPDSRLLVASSFYASVGTDLIIARLESTTSLERWRLTHFGTQLSNGIAADDFDLDGDGLANLTEYGFGLDPKRGGQQGLPGGSMVNGQFATSFAPPAGVEGISYSAEWSRTLGPGSWLPVPDTGEQGQHAFSIPLTDPRGFMRLKVTLQ